MADTPDNPAQKSDTDIRREHHHIPADTSDETPKSQEEAEAMEEAQRAGAEQRKEGGYQ